MYLSACNENKMSKVVAFDVGVRNLGVCIAACREAETDEKIVFPFSIIHWLNADTCKPQRKGKMTAEECVHDVVTWLKGWWEVKNADVCFISEDVHFVIEAQMRKGGAINIVAHAIQAFLLTQGVNDEHIHFQSPIHKLKIARMILGDSMPDVDVNATSRYSCNKQTGVQHVQALLRSDYFKKDENKKWTNLFYSANKKDDLGDSALHAFFWLYKNNYPSGPRDFKKHMQTHEHNSPLDLLICLERSSRKRGRLDASSDDD